MLRLLTLASLVVAAPSPQAADLVAAILDALRLPAVVTEARQAGVPEASVREVLDGLRRGGLPADEAAMVLRDEVDAVKAGEDKDNFGGFVQRQLAIRAHPAAADSVLASHGLTRAGLDTLMYDVAADPALAQAYTEATR